MDIVNLKFYDGIEHRNEIRDILIIIYIKVQYVRREITTDFINTLYDTPKYKYQIIRSSETYQDDLLRVLDDSNFSLLTEAYLYDEQNLWLRIQAAKERIEDKYICC